MRLHKISTLLATSALAFGLAACESVGTPTTPLTASVPVAAATVPTPTAVTPTGTTTTGTTTTTTPGATGTPGLLAATAPTSLTPAVAATPTAPSPTLGTLTGPLTFTSASASQRLAIISGGALYEGNQPVTINDQVKITRDPRDATYTIVIAPQGNIVANTRFQDPAHRSIYASIAQQDLIRYPSQPTTDWDLSALLPDIPNTEYYGTGQLLSGDAGAPTIKTAIFFTERMGNANSSTQYVSWGSYWEYNAGGVPPTRSQSLQRTASVFGFNTLASNVPKTGSASYKGGFYADLVEGRDFYTLSGASNVVVDFASDKGTFALGGNFVSAGPGDPSTKLRLGTTFTASGTIGLLRPANATASTGGGAPISVFSGKVTALALGGVTYENLPNETKALSFQASSVEGGFFGPQAEEVGATFRIVGGLPDVRLDITGALTGRKN